MAKRFSMVSTFSVGSGLAYIDFLPYPGILLSTEKIMWSLFLLVPFFLVLHDFMKLPIDRLYFNNPRRILMGMQNTLIDFLLYQSDYSVQDYPGLWLIKLHHLKIRQEFEKVSRTAKKYLFHEADPWFDKNDSYYFYKVEDFPILNDLINQIPIIYRETALFAVSDGPLIIPPHRAESNSLLRYHLTIESSGDCTLYTERGIHEHREGDDFLFDHSRYHEVVKTDSGRRVVLILDVKRL